VGRNRGSIATEGSVSEAMMYSMGQAREANCSMLSDQLWSQQV
jgi:hypothetical protein